MLALASTPSLSAAATAVPGIQKGPWHGKTKQGLPADFSVLKTQHGLVVEPYDVAVLATCEIQATNSSTTSEAGTFLWRRTATSR
jgi:hypothetical protein